MVFLVITKHTPSKYSINCERCNRNKEKNTFVFIHKFMVYMVFVHRFSRVLVMCRWWFHTGKYTESHLSCCFLFSLVVCIFLSVFRISVVNEQRNYNHRTNKKQNSENISSNFKVSVCFCGFYKFFSHDLGMWERVLFCNKIPSSYVASKIVQWEIWFWKSVNPFKND